jgi:hypothetical protein
MGCGDWGYLCGCAISVLLKLVLLLGGLVCCSVAEDVTEVEHLLHLLLIRVVTNYSDFVRYASHGLFLDRFWYGFD